MAKLVWDKVGERLYETGVSKGVVYEQAADGSYSKGEAWNGLTAVNESPSGGEPTPLYANNHKYLELMSDEDFGFTVEAYTYPDAFAKCNGESDLAPGVSVTQQERKPFGFTYQSIIGNDTTGRSHGYKIHLVYGCKAKPSERNHNTVNNDPEAETMSWECSTTPIDVPGMTNPCAHIVVDSTKVASVQLTALEAKLYGSENGEPTLPLPEELATIFNGNG